MVCRIITYFLERMVPELPHGMTSVEIQKLQSL